ncbi:MBL fold metallo-hydrolase [Pseudonocardia broussonetiae]|uniref:MBL fold metallo-hydrolase n=1 Tax=Pseudonocardia broussonetiae TaxID=2736640 RepID=A0A6M6JRY8_9PSEU|nr:MBL fold metallo-hydrolase [Pseudonocardia broussonetiae]QJY49402.1 MBL fold metallo-hydrolase [Pseudonocardia broussonetiae]
MSVSDVPELESLGGGFHAFVQPDGGWGLNNAGVFTGRRGATLIDTAFTENRGRGLQDAVASITDRPVTTIVNTHHHGDHTYANYLFGSATVVAHHACRERVLATGLDTCRLFPGVEWGDLEIAEPTVTFDGEVVVHCDDTPALARHVGRAAHTVEDVYVWVAERRLLFAGDLVFHGGTPFVVMGSVQGLIDTLTELRALDADVLVPGHGAVGDPGLIEPQLAYLRLVQERAREGFAAGLPPLEVARRTDLGEFATWTDAERLPANLHRAYSELRGEPPGVLLDLPPIVADMVAFNDGRPLHSLA